MFISGGENVYPAEIEAVVAGIAGVKEAATVGVADERWGEVGHLFWVAHPGASVACRHSGSSSRNLARYKTPKHFSRIDALPRNGAGKVLKIFLREMAATETVSE
ncbi:AMP-binding enzyme [Hyphococcus sp.]|uniref:AMP-binding enzyme n=1 Tax=Hyphococcus sp. TaxID=2038636 RepID=UPI0035C66ECB